MDKATKGNSHLSDKNFLASSALLVVKINLRQIFIFNFKLDLKIFR